MSSYKIQKVFAQAVPEIGDGVVEIMAVARRPGYRTKVAVSSHHPEVDCIAACVGVRGSRIASIVARLEGERVDLVRWDASVETLISKALLPAEIEDVRLDTLRRRATVVVRKDQRALALGRGGSNRQLAGELCGYEIEIETLEPFAESA
jgi:N utilization substance protein A